MVRTLVVSALGLSLVAATLVVGINVNVSSITGEQEEVDVAMDPTNNNHLIGGSNDAARGYPWTRIYESNNGGTSWSTLQLPTPANSPFSSDPALTFDRLGNAYYAYIAYNNSFQLSLQVAKKAAGASTWGPNVQVPAIQPDKEFIVTDTDPASSCVDSVYVAWDNNETNGQTLRVSRSSNGGQTFQAPPQVNDVTAAAIGANPAVGPGGIVYVAWSEHQAHKILFDKSTDCGRTWGTDKVLVNWTLPTGTDLAYKPPSNPSRGAPVFPYLAVDLSNGPRRGRVYLVYADLSTSPGGNADVFMRYSDDQGNNWSSAIRINDDTGSADQYMPRMSIDQNDGTLHVIWYDTRNDPNRRKTDLYYARSVDGQTFLPNEKATTAMSDKSGVSGMGYGEYVGIAASHGKAYLFWTDTRTNDDEVFGSEVLTALGVGLSTLPKALVNQAYSATLLAGGGTPPYQWAATGLPSWSALNPATGQVSGTPSTADLGTSSVNVTVTDSVGATASRMVGLEVGYPPLAIGNAQLPAGRIHEAYSVQLTATGGLAPYSWAATGLPSSLTLSSTGLLSGTPVDADAGARNIQVTLSDAAGGTLSRTFSLAIAGSPLSVGTTTLPNAQERAAFGPIQLAASGGTPPFSWSWTSGYAPPSGVQLLPTGLLSGTPVRGSAGNHSLRLTVRDASVPSRQTFSGSLPLIVFGVPVADPGVDRTVEPGEQVLDGSASVDPAGNSLQFTWTPPSGITLSDLTSARPTATLTKAGEYPFQLSVKSSAGVMSDPKEVLLTVRNVPPTVKLAAVAPTTVGSQVSLDASESSDPNGDSLTFSWFQIGGPPTPLAALSGPRTLFVPTEPSTYTFRVAASDGTTTTTGDIELTVTAAEATNGCGCTTGGASAAPWIAALLASTRWLRRRRR